MTGSPCPGDYRSANALAISTAETISAPSILQSANTRQTCGCMPIQEIRETRLRNLQLAMQECGSQAALAERIGTDPSYVSQLFGKWRGRGMGDKFARKIEHALKKPPGWMDTQHPELWSKGDMAKAAGKPLIPRDGKSAQLLWLEAEQRELTEGSLSTVMALVERLRSLEREAEAHQPPRGKSPK
jgi:hypothetical protein